VRQRTSLRAVSRDTSFNGAKTEAAAICRNLIRAKNARADARLRIRDIDVA
jgi:hypothetical protein